MKTGRRAGNVAGQDVALHGSDPNLHEAKGAPAGLLGPGDSQLGAKRDERESRGPAHFQGDDRRFQLRPGEERALVEARF